MRNNHLTTLHILLVLTFLTAGFNLMGYGLTALMLPSLQQVYADNPGLIPEQMQTYMDMYLAMPRLFFVAEAALFALELAGGILMWRLHQSGFHAYTLARMLLLLVPVLFLGKGFLQLGDVMFAVLFILAYWLLLKQLGVFGGKNGDSPTPVDTPDTPQE